MSFEWNNKYAIMKDLSLAQGFNVPIDVEELLGAGDKPPSLDLLEETEEEYFSSYTGCYHEIEAPDLGSIQEMLSLVNAANDEESTDDTLQETKLSTGTLPSNDNEEIKPKTKKRGINVALESIMQSNAIQKTQNAPSNTKPLLLKPEYFIGEDVTEKRNENKTSTQNGAIKKHVTLDRVSNKKKPVLELQPNSMFKKKLSPLKSKESSLQKTEIETNTSPALRKEVVKTLNNSLDLQARNSKNAQDAKKLFQTYINLVHMKKEVVNNVWSRAEREMKEIDDMRNRQFTESELAYTFPDMNVEEAQRLKLVLLPRHRHYLPDDCLVCEVEYSHQKKTKQTVEPIKDSDDSLEDTNITNITRCKTPEDLEKVVCNEAEQEIVTSESNTEQHSSHQHTNTVLESKQEIVTSESNTEQHSSHQHTNTVLESKQEIVTSEEANMSQVAINKKIAQDAKELIQKYLKIVNIKEGASGVRSLFEREIKTSDDFGKKQLSEEELQENFPGMGIEEAQRLRVVLLPRHRHYLPGDCRVCELEYNHQMKKKQTNEPIEDMKIYDDVSVDDINVHDIADCGTYDLDETVPIEDEMIAETVVLEEVSDS